jgi:hypothetical protein
MSRNGKAFRDAALELLMELENAHLEVVLIPSQDSDCAMRGGMIRAVQESNADWYRSYCDRYQSSRRRRSHKSDTRIKRAHTVKALERVIRGQLDSAYAERLEPFIRQRMKEARSRDRVGGGTKGVPLDRDYSMGF